MDGWQYKYSKTTPINCFELQRDFCIVPSAQKPRSDKFGSLLYQSYVNWGEVLFRASLSLSETVMSSLT